jgi:hypothetical protein
VTHFERNEYGISDAALEQRVAELSPAEYNALVARTRFPTLTPEQIAAETHRAVMQSKSQMLVDQRAQMDEQAGVISFGNLPGKRDQIAPPAEGQQ